MARPLHPDPRLAAGYARCAELTRAHGTTYYWGARLLPREQRIDVYTVYALCRLADDIVNAVDIREAVAAPETVLMVFNSMRETITPELVLDHTRALFTGDVIRASYVTPATGEASAEAIRAALASTGLDPEGTDRLLVLGSLDERKQTRRDALAKTHCIVAILGDERADFDELYLYLKDREAVVPSDAIIGRGWFLATPIVSEG